MIIIIESMFLICEDLNLHCKVAYYFNPDILPKAEKIASTTNVKWLCWGNHKY